MDRFSKSWKCLTESTFQGSSPTAAISFSAVEEKPGRSGWSGGLGEELWQASIRRVRIGNKARGLSGTTHRQTGGRNDRCGSEANPAASVLSFGRAVGVYRATQ